MDSDAKQSLFQVYLRLRPAHQQASKNANEPWLFVEPPAEAVEAGQQTLPTHITLQPPNDSRKRAVEKFGFTKVFEEHASQLDIFEGAGTTQLLQGVLQNGRDGLLATLGVTGSGKVCQKNFSCIVGRYLTSTEPYYTGLSHPARIDADES